MGERLSDLSGRALFAAVRKAALRLGNRRRRLYVAAMLRGFCTTTSNASKLYADGLISYTEFRVCQTPYAHRETQLAINHTYSFLYRDTNDPRVAPYTTQRMVAAALCCCEEPIPVRASELIRVAAQTIYQEEDWEAMPIFADMLDDAELPQHAAHCRTPFHARGCWVLESLR